VPPTFGSVNPQPAQAKRFLRQAQEDLRAADNDYDAEEPAFEWACFKAHQVYSLCRYRAGHFIIIIIIIIIIIYSYKNKKHAGRKGCFLNNANKCPKNKKN